MRGRRSSGITNLLQPSVPVLPQNRDRQNITVRYAAVPNEYVQMESDTPHRNTTTSSQTGNQRTVEPSSVQRSEMRERTVNQTDRDHSTLSPIRQGK